MTERGKIFSRKSLRQVVSFDNLRWGKITPTDIDMFLDFGDKLFVFVEAKFGESPLGRGQELALERLCDACHAPPKRRAVAFVVRHDVPAADDIEVSVTQIVRYRWNGKWREPARPTRLVDGIEWFRKKL